MATATKTARKPKSKRASKPTAKKNGKPTNGKPKTQSVKMRSVKLTNADGKKRTVRRPVEAHQFGGGGTVRIEQYAAAADRASQIACTDGDGKPLNRARIGSVQIMAVANVLGRRTPAAALKTYTGAKSQTAALTMARTAADSAEAYVEQLDTDARKRIGELSKLEATTETGGVKTTKTLAARKLTGRALLAAVVALAETGKNGKRS